LRFAAFRHHTSTAEHLLDQTDRRLRVDRRKFIVPSERCHKISVLGVLDDKMTGTLADFEAVSDVEAS